ncbi:hypothetical protein R1sor_005680 [Riccia sorocarpa]|uniref:Uncharacterized protein n=1 Tax=Riccia sorocarpa TaxID=122646 RepID=A0ABD3HRR7_9MARC
MNACLMEGAGVVLKAKEEWGKHPTWVRRTEKWALGLGRIHKLLMEENNKQGREPEGIQSLQLQYLKARLQGQNLPTEGNKEGLESVLKKAQESTSALKRDNGDMINDQCEILSDVEQIYSTLYAAEQEAETTASTRHEMLQLIYKKLTAEQNMKMQRLPDEKLIERTFKELPKEKSPGIDGVVVEIRISTTTPSIPGDL